MIAQDPSKHPGSIIRINIDGSIPKDNPSNKNKPNWLRNLSNWCKKSAGDGNISFESKNLFSQHGPREQHWNFKEILDGRMLHGEAKNIMEQRLGQSHSKKNTTFQLFPGFRP